MKLVDRKTFLELPEGTIYYQTQSKLTANGYSFLGDFGELCIKNESWSDDWIYAPIHPDLKANDSEEYLEKWDYMLHHQNTELESQTDFQRDGFYEEDQLFIIFNKQEIQSMINLLKKGL